jgi:hypothetical protein
MKTSVLLASVCAMVMALFAVPANAQATRTWVSGVGDDANPCSRTAPCKTFAGAISKTATAGEINCLDPGGFGAVTITKSISIICQAGTAGVLVSGTNGIAINAAPTDVVYLSGLDFEGVGSGLSGVQINTAAVVHIMHCIIRGFTIAGVSVTPSSGGISVDVIDTVIADNTGTASGIEVRPTSTASVRLTLDHTRLSNNAADGVAANANVTTGSVKVVVRDCEASNNVGNGFSAFSNSGAAQQLIDSSTMFNNNTGIGVSGSNAIIRFTRSTISGNATGVSGTVSSALSYGTNSIDGNGSVGTFGTTTQQ